MAATLQKRSWILIMVLACAVAPAGVRVKGPESSWSFLRGMFVASFDAMRGHYKELGAGLTSDALPEYVRLLQARYGIEHDELAGCVLSDSMSAYIRGYNTVSVAAAKRKFGPDVFAECYRS